MCFVCVSAQCGRTEQVAQAVPVPIFDPPPPREINQIVNVPVHDPSLVIKFKTAGPPRVVKHYVTKTHYVPEPVPSLPTYHYKPVAVPVHVPGKAVHVPIPMPAKTIYKELPITKVQHVIQKRSYDCVAGLNWKGCPGTWQGDGLTKTIVTGVTQHIGLGHVNVIHRGINHIVTAPVCAACLHRSMH
ncbi:unnamed protein product [Symbiodinium sp. CCMP2456]|nr:unnamed protein product [Symbiodinium sp. CCMP2456]